MKLAKKIVSLSMVLIAFTCVFGGCGKENDNLNSSDINQDDHVNDEEHQDEGSDTEKKPDDKEEETPVPPVVDLSNLNKLMRAIEEENFTEEVKGNIIKVNQNLICYGNVIYEKTTTETGIPVQYSYTPDEVGDYVKQVYDVTGKDNVFNQVQAFKEFFSSVDWDAEDENHFKSGDISLEYNNTFDMWTLDVNGSKTYVSNTSKTVVNLPSPNRVKDETTHEEEKSALIYDSKTKKWNHKLLADTLLDWIQKNDYYTKYLTGSRYNHTIDKIIYVNVNDGKFVFGAELTLRNGSTGDITPAFAAFYATDGLNNFLNGGENITEASISKYLDDHKLDKPIKTEISPISLEYSLSVGTSEQNAQFKAMVSKILGDMSNPDNKYYNEKAKNATLLFGLKTPKSSEFASASNGYGYVQGWDMFMLVNVGDSVQLWKVGIAASSMYGISPEDNVVNRPDLWNVGGFELVANADYENVDLYSSTK